MTRYWVSWWSNYAPEDVPFDYWTSGYKFKPDARPLDDASEDEDEEDDGMIASICALIDAPNEEAIWERVAELFPDYEYRFCEEREPDYTPGDRFRGGEGKTSLT